MKVIKASIDLKTWSSKQTCPNCLSEIGVEAEDIRYFWTQNGGYYYICCLCDHREYLKEKEVPEIVKADVLKSRRDPTYSRDD